MSFRHSGLQSEEEDGIAGPVLGEDAAALTRMRLAAERQNAKPAGTAGREGHGHILSGRQCPSIGSEGSSGHESNKDEGNEQHHQSIGSNCLSETTLSATAENRIFSSSCSPFMRPTIF